ncbi:MAG: hypothetical protein ACYT04_38135 [Nostoc sp.]
MSKAIANLGLVTARCRYFCLWLEKRSQQNLSSLQVIWDYFIGKSTYLMQATHLA